jgi:adenine-specific DNA-methyltransferase
LQTFTAHSFVTNNPKIDIWKLNMPIEKLRPTFTLTEDRIKELQAVIPEAFADGKINWDTLREALGETLEDETKEHFGLFWPGKREARRLATLPSKGTLIPQPGEGMNEEKTHNLFIEGDNLEVLKLLQKSYAGRVKLIYIDPPYNTGNDFVYPDDYSEPLDAYLKRTGQVDEAGQMLTTNARASGRYHSNWLNMIYPRLLLARQLLQENGVIFLSIDDNEIYNLRSLANEIFGEENFIGQIIVQSNPRGSQSIKYLASVHEYIVIYAKNAAEFDMKGLELSDAMKEEYKYTFKDGRKYRLLGLRQRGGAWRREDRPSLFFPIWIDTKTGETALEKSSKFSKPVNPIQPTTGEEGSWRWSKGKIQNSPELIIARQVSRDGDKDAWDIFQIDFMQAEAGDERTTKAKTLWIDKEINYQNGRTEVRQLFGGKDVFDFPKPVYLLQKIFEMVGLENGDIILDFFAGSCTTAHALLDFNFKNGLGTKFVVIQLPELTPKNSPAYKAGYRTIADIGRDRIRRVTKSFKRNNQGKLQLGSTDGFGFRSYKLDYSTFKEWELFTSKATSQLELRFEKAETPLVEGWKPENLLSEILLLQGFPLDSSVRSLPEFKGNDVQDVTSEFVTHPLYVCLDKKIKAETIAKLSLRAEDIFVCLDSALSDEAKVKLTDQCNLKVI